MTRAAAARAAAVRAAVARAAAAVARAAARARAAAVRAMVMPEHSWQYSPQTPHSKSYKDHCCADYTGNIVELREQNCNQSSLCTSLLCK